ncbi:MAG: hypothetical protein ACD_28C00150G0003 [uncultured bacterium]|nr:MAG: hypothetical protein ACD_28C00150G0003 [uncultured bacterium]KKT75222.1 MAG: NAD-dependent epimerase/dehydratase [Candidatus Peregrinibacteria bacterium GW2011_GWA2_44_7]
MNTFDFLANQQILVTGGHGFLGSHVVKLLKENGMIEDRLQVPSRRDFDLRERSVCRALTKGKTLVIHLAGNVGGIGYNNEHMAEMFYDNLVMGTELMEAARQEGVTKFVTLGTICSYPKTPPIPFNEDSLWDGYPEEITGPYGLVKKMQLVQGQVYRKQYGFNSIFLLPTNLYGPGDHSTHVIAQLIDRIVTAHHEQQPRVTIWGSGKATRDFLYVKDAADAILKAAEHYNENAPINLGSGIETSIRELVETIVELVKYKGEIEWDLTKPEGQPRRLLDIQRAKNAFGFSPQTSLKEGLQQAIDWYGKKLC